MPDVLDVYTQSSWSSGTGITLSGLQDHAGRRLVLVGVDRSGGETVTLSGSDSGLVAALGTPAAQRVTLPGDSGARRSVWLWTCIIPTVDPNPIITVDIRDGGNGQVTGSAVAWVVDADSSYVLSQTADDDSGSSTVTSQGTGTTATVPAGDVVTAVAAAIRGETTVAWSTADHEPANPEGGAWLLEVVSGTGAGQRHGVGGHGDLGAQSEQTYTDMLTLGTARMVSTVIAVFVAASSGTVIADSPTAARLAGASLQLRAGATVADTPAAARLAGLAPGLTTSGGTEVADTPAAVRLTGRSAAAQAGTTIPDTPAAARPAAGRLALLQTGTTVQDATGTLRLATHTPTVQTGTTVPDTATPVRLASRAAQLTTSPLAQQVTGGPPAAARLAGRAPAVAAAAGVTPGVLTTAGTSPTLVAAGTRPALTAAGTAPTLTTGGSP